MNEYIGPSAAKEMAIDAGARDVPWVASFLVWCSDTADARHTIDVLKSTSPDRFHNQRSAGRNANHKKGRRK
jgi:hypothetical protein